LILAKVSLKVPPVALALLSKYSFIALIVVTGGIPVAALLRYAISFRAGHISEMKSGSIKSVMISPK